MSRFRYTAQMLEFLESGYKQRRLPELTRMFNREYGCEKTELQIKYTLNRKKFTCDRKPGLPKDLALKLLTIEQRDFVVENYPAMTRKKLTAALNARFGTTITVQQIITFTKNHKIRSGRTGQWTSGHDSWNKGSKGLTSKNSTSFSSGNVPPNVKPLGHERIDAKDGYIWVKVAEVNPHTGHATRYVQKHHKVWREHHGEIPTGHLVVFWDGDRLNSDIDNLRCIPRAVMLYLNRHGFKDLPQELKPSMLATAQLATKTFEMQRA